MGELDLDLLLPVTEPQRKNVFPFRLNKLFQVHQWASKGTSEEDTGKGSITETYDLNEADVVSSRRRGTYDIHTPVLDIDIPAALVPSSTPGKHHLYLDAPMPWDTYVALLDALADAGILEKGYVAASKVRGFTAVRLPWIRKG